MNITKDEARILAEALSEDKYAMVDKMPKEVSTKVFDALEDLENRLTEFGQDKRRNGRTSQNDFSDLLKRYSKIK